MATRDHHASHEASEHHTANGQLSPNEHRQHAERDEHTGHGQPGGHAGHGNHGDHAAQFRDRFWWSLALTVPVVVYSEMVQEWLRFTPPQFPGSQWVAPVLGTVVFVYGGRPFLEGGLAELRNRQPGMMLLISLAILVAFGASLATVLEVFDLEFWWELALLVVIMLLGHWLEMRALGQASSALDALAALLPDEAVLVTPEGTRTVPISELAVSDLVLVRPGGRVPADGVVADGEAELDESMITGESRPVPKRPATGWSRGRWSPTRPCGSGSTRSARRRPWPGSAGWSNRPRPPVRVPRGRAPVLLRRRDWPSQLCGLDAGR
jgi:Cu2+-exporting ATPase